LRRGAAKAEAFEKLKFFQVFEECVESQEGAAAAVGSAGENRYGPLKIHVQEGVRRSA
jgi:hypothetical protein